MLKMTESSIEEILQKAASTITISEQMFDAAESEYKKMGAWINENTPSYDIEIYPQGSFALGTVVQPFDRDDEYDLDLVCEYQQLYGFSAKRLKTIEVRSILDQYARANSITEKRRCWQVTYEHNSRFHMDVVPAIKQGQYIWITDLNEQIYSYLGSNPKEYAAWFQQKQLGQYNAIKQKLLLEAKETASARGSMVEPIKESRIKTPLQKAIMILKRHRDIVFANDNSHVKPISIIITTLAAALYKNQSTIVETLRSFFAEAKCYIDQNKKAGQYFIPNPVYTGAEKENFADKWNLHPERANAFFTWMETAEHDLITALETATTFDEAKMLIGSSLGEKVATNVFAKSTSVAQREQTAVTIGKIRAIMQAPQKEQLPFKCPERTSVYIRATVTEESGKIYCYKDDGTPLPKNAKIEFQACFSGINKPYSIRWQVVNTGEEAAIEADLRGKLEAPTTNTVKIEHTRYTGFHSVQCFIQQHGRCIAKSKIFIVNVR